jgi:hypothetical protein
VGALVLTLYLSTPANVPWTVADGKLEIRARVWKSDFPLRDLETSQTQVLNLELDPNWRPEFKENGYSGFGYRAGRFSLRNGREVDLFLASETVAVLIPRHGSVPVMVGVHDPAAFLAALQGGAR